MEEQLSKIDSSYVTKDKLEAEIAKAELRSFMQGKEFGYKRGAFVFGLIGAACVFITLTINVVTIIAK